MNTFAQSIFSSASEETIGILQIWWILAGLGSLAFFATMVFLVLSVSRNKVAPSRSTKSKPYWLYGGVGVTVLAVFIVLIATFLIKPTIDQVPPGSLKIEVIGKQWWWEVKYLDPNNQEVIFTTANEIVIPINEPIHLILKSADVIHSFWVPALAGKVDMIPGQTNHLVVEAKEKGDFRGQCAEFCGLQHAKMGFMVSALSQEQFEEWRREMLKPHNAPSNGIEKEGFDVFQSVGCGACHNIRGLVSRSSVLGPNLSHLTKRQTLGAAIMPNRRGHLASWVANPANAKIGTSMPRTLMSGAEFQALIAFLESLE